MYTTSPSPSLRDMSVAKAGRQSPAARLRSQIPYKNGCSEVVRALPKYRCVLVRLTSEAQQRRDRYILVLVDAASFFYSDDRLTMDGYHGGRQAAACLRKGLVEHLESLANDGLVVPKFETLIIYGFADVAWWAAAADHGDLLRRVLCLENFIKGLDSDHRSTCFEDVNYEVERSRSGFKDVTTKLQNDPSCMLIWRCTGKERSALSYHLESCLDKGLADGSLRMLAKESKAKHPREIKRCTNGQLNGGSKINSQTEPTGSTETIASNAQYQAQTPTPSTLQKPVLSNGQQLRRNMVTESSRRVFRNKLGCRIDLPLQDLPPAGFIKRIAARNYCSNYHLRRTCRFRNSCKYFHGDWTPPTAAALRCIARGSHCRNGTGCSDPDCYAGHMCPWKPCLGGCGFPDAMHYMDTVIALVFD